MTSAKVTQTAGALLIDADGRVLLGLRAAWKTVAPCLWDTIGGRLEPGEQPDEALIREVQEEIGVTPTRFRLIATVPEPMPELYGPMIHYVYAVTAWAGGEPSNICDEHSEIGWFTPEEVLELNRTAFDFEGLIKIAQSP